MFFLYVSTFSVARTKNSWCYFIEDGNIQELGVGNLKFHKVLVCVPVMKLMVQGTNTTSAVDPAYYSVFFYKIKNIPPLGYVWI